MGMPSIVATGSTPSTTFSFLLVLSSGTMIRPHQPSPQTATFSIRPGSIDGRAGIFDRARPAVDFAVHQFRKSRRGGAGDDIDAATRQALDHFGRLHRLLRHGEQPVDHLLRRARRDENSLPGPAVESRE